MAASDVEQKKHHHSNGCLSVNDWKKFIYTHPSHVETE